MCVFSMTSTTGEKFFIEVTGSKLFKFLIFGTLIYYCKGTMAGLKQGTCFESALALNLIMLVKTG